MNKEYPYPTGTTTLGARDYEPGAAVTPRPTMGGVADLTSALYGQLGSLYDLVFEVHRRLGAHFPPTDAPCAETSREIDNPIDAAAENIRRCFVQIEECRAALNRIHDRI